MSGSLSTHILDTATGRPAEGVEIELFRLEGNGREKVTSCVTNADGRTDVPLLTADAFATGFYELEFKVGVYLRSKAKGKTDLPDPLFLDVIPIRFGMAEAKHYHVPLLLSPFGYSTYRGS